MSTQSTFYVPTQPPAPQPRSKFLVLSIIGNIIAVLAFAIFMVTALPALVFNPAPAQQSQPTTTTGYVNDTAEVITFQLAVSADDKSSIVYYTIDGRTMSTVLNSDNWNLFVEVAPGESLGPIDLEVASADGTSYSSCRIARYDNEFVEDGSYISWNDEDHGDASCTVVDPIHAEVVE